MVKSFDKLRNKMSIGAQKKAVAKAEKIMAKMALCDLRKALKISQEHLAETLETKQSNVSRMERRTDMYISTLRIYVEAMGGELDIIAKFPEGNVHINQFQNIAA